MTDPAAPADSTQPEPGSQPGNAPPRDRGGGGGLADMADRAGRVWGLILLGVGLWLFARITLQLDLPDIPVGDLWPLVLILFGGMLLLRSGRRRR